MASNPVINFSDWSGNRPALGPEAQPEQERCITNISARERQKRLLAGGVEFVIGLAIFILLIVFGLNPWWRLGLFLPFFGAGIGFFQWRDKT